MDRKQINETSHWQVSAQRFVELSSAASRFTSVEATARLIVYRQQFHFVDRHKQEKGKNAKYPAVLDCISVAAIGSLAISEIERRNLRYHSYVNANCTVKTHNMKEIRSAR